MEDGGPEVLWGSGSKMSWENLCLTRPEEHYGNELKIHIPVCSNFIYFKTFQDVQIVLKRLELGLETS
jgi:hypothetical protein